MPLSARQWSITCQVHAEAAADAALLQHFSGAVGQTVGVAVQGVHQLDLASVGSSPVCAYAASP